MHFNPVILRSPTHILTFIFSPHGVSIGSDLGGLDEPEGTCETIGGVLPHSRLVVEGMAKSGASSTDFDRCVFSLSLLARRI
eukprot:SAG11_NODE_39_length_21630_cov_11.188658_17_plen_82_part_00